MKTYKINPAEQRVVVLPLSNEETKTRSGIIIPVTAEENKPGIGKVISVGKGSADSPMLYREGQYVLYSQYSGLEVKLNLENHGDNTYKVMNQLDIIGIVELTQN